MKKLRKSLGILMLVSAMALPVSAEEAALDIEELQYAEVIGEPSEMPDFNGISEEYDEAEVFADSDDNAEIFADDEIPEDATVVWEFHGEDESELQTVKKSNASISVTNDYAANGNGSFFVEVTGAYGSVQIPFEIETGALYRLTYYAALPTGASPDTIVQSNIYATPKSFHQGQIKPQVGRFNKYTKMLYYPKDQFITSWYGFYCNNAGSRFLLDDLVMIKYDDFGIARNSSFYDGVKDIDIYSEIYLPLNYTVDPNSLGKVSIVDEDGNEVDRVTANLMYDQKTLEIQHSLLENHKNYTLKIESATDTVGRSFKDLEIGFTTVDDIVVDDMAFNTSKLANGEISLSGMIRNCSAENQSAVIKIWLYEGQRMRKRVSVPVEIQLGMPVNLSEAVMNFSDLSSGKYTFAAAVWKDDENIRPLCKSIRLEQ